MSELVVIFLMPVAYICYFEPQLITNHLFHWLGIKGPDEE